MAWDPNDKKSYAGHSKEVSEHGGVEQYNNDIYEEGCRDTRRTDAIVGGMLGIISVAGLIGQHIYFKHKLKVQQKNEIRRKADRAQDSLLNDDVYTNQISDTDSSSTEKEENNE